MHTEKLLSLIQARFETRRAFIVAFNEASGEELDETTLSRQLSGKIALSAGWRAAYTLFFKIESNAG